MHLNAVVVGVLNNSDSFIGQIINGRCLIRTRIMAKSEGVGIHQPIRPWEDCSAFDIGSSNERRIKFFPGKRKQMNKKRQSLGWPTF